MAINKKNNPIAPNNELANILEPQTIRRPSVNGPALKYDCESHYLY